MVKHELYCNYNPNNFRACLGCEHLEEVRISYHVESDYEYMAERKSTGFKCKKHEQLYYPFKVEKKGLVDKYPDTFEGQKPMPKECSDFKSFDFFS